MTWKDQLESPNELKVKNDKITENSRRCELRVIECHINVRVMRNIISKITYTII